MANTINASTTSTSGLVYNADASGVLQLQSNGVTGLTVEANASVTVNTVLQTPNGRVEPLVLENVKSASGASVTFTDIPSWVKRITVTLNAVSSTTANGNMLLRIGSGTVETSGYFGIGFGVAGGTSSTPLQTTGIYAGATGSSASTEMYSTITLVLHNASTNTWAGSMVGVRDDGTDVFQGGYGSISLSGPLTVLSLIPGAGTFDAGTVNIMYE
jgi:hypothetical protein